MVDNTSRVLIETLWNVKFNSAGGYWNIYYRINRNIVECKVSICYKLYVVASAY